MSESPGRPSVAPEVEPLHDMAWSRIERGLWTRLDGDQVEDHLAYRSQPVRFAHQVERSAHRIEDHPADRSRVRSSTRWLQWAIPATAAVAAAIAIVVTRPTGHNEPVTTARMVSESAPSSMTFGDAHVTLDPHSALVMVDARDTALVERGGAWFSVAPRPVGRPFSVLAGDATVRVVGTRFYVAHDEQRTAVSVEHGIVVVQYRDQVIELRAGDQWSTATQTATAEPDPKIEIENDPSPPEPSVTERPRPRTKPALKPPTAPTQPGVAAPPVPPPPPAAIDPRAEFRRLAALEPSDPAGAIAGYLEIAKQPGSWGELALFAAGRLAHDRRDPRTIDLLERYLTRYPSGANRDDARELLAAARRW